jgi:hypothetical protein
MEKTMDTQQHLRDESRWIREHMELLVNGAKRGYELEGRGALFVRRREASTDRDQEVAYLSDAAVTKEGVGWPDTWVKDRIATYDPASELVVVFSYDNKEVNTHRIRFQDGEHQVE